MSPDSTIEKIDTMDLFSDLATAIDTAVTAEREALDVLRAYCEIDGGKPATPSDGMGDERILRSRRAHITDESPTNGRPTSSSVRRQCSSGVTSVVLMLRDVEPAR